MGKGNTKNIILIGLIVFAGYVTRNVWGPILHRGSAALDNPSATQLISAYGRRGYAGYTDFDDPY
jgi:hypothetical protein